MISVDILDVCFNFRVVGVCIEENHILLQQFAESTYWCLPGGRVEIREATAAALQREMQEELGETVQIQRLLWVVENFFEIEKSFHEIGYYYEMALPAASQFHEKHCISAGQDGDTRFILQWFPIDALAELPLVPPFLRTRLAQLPTGIEHIVEVERS